MTALLRFLQAPLFTLAFFPIVAMAAGGGHNGHGEHHGVPWSTLIFSTVNLLIFLFLLRRYAWPAIRNSLLDRHRRVVKALEDAAKARQEAEALKAQWQSRLAQLGSEMEALRKQARDEMAREQERLLADAQRAAEKIRQDAERAATQELREARERLCAETAREALAIARNLAHQRITSADQEKFVNDFLTKIAP